MITFSTGKTGKQSVIPETHECGMYIDYIEGYQPNDDSVGRLNNPQDIFVHRQDNIYIADTGNNAVVKLDAEGRFVMAITEESGGIRYPLGIFVDENQDILWRITATPVSFTSMPRAGMWRNSWRRIRSCSVKTSPLLTPPN